MASDYIWSGKCPTCQWKTWGRLNGQPPEACEACDYSFKPADLYKRENEVAIAACVAMEKVDQESAALAKLAEAQEVYLLQLSPKRCVVLKPELMPIIKLRF